MRPSPEIPSEGNRLIPVTPQTLQFSRARGVLELTRSYPIKEEWEEWLHSARQTLVDRGATLGTIESERPSSPTPRGGQERIGEDSSQHIPGGIHLPLGGRANEYDPGKGERDNMSRFPCTALTGFAAVKTVLEPRPDDILERLLVELSQKYPVIELKELEGRLMNLSELLVKKNADIKKAYRSVRTALGVSVAFLCGAALGCIFNGEHRPLQTYKNGGHSAYDPADHDDIVTVIKSGIRSVPLVSYSKWYENCGTWNRIKHRLL